MRTNLRRSRRLIRIAFVYALYVYVCVCVCIRVESRQVSFIRSFRVSFNFRWYKKVEVGTVTFDDR